MYPRQLDSSSTLFKLNFQTTTIGGAEFPTSFFLRWIYFYVTSLKAFTMPDFIFCSWTLTDEICYREYFAFLKGSFSHLILNEPFHFSGLICISFGERANYLLFPQKDLIFMLNETRNSNTFATYIQSS